MIKSDVAKVQALCEHSHLKYEPQPLDSLESAFVVVDEDDEPRAMMGAERVAEIILVLDRDYQTPSFRAVIVEALAARVRESLESNNYRAAYAFFGDDVPKGFDRRLYEMGARQMVNRCVKFVRGDD
jgi:hypothetical protein